MNLSGQLSPSKTLEILKEIGHEPAKKLGQNFLIDSNIVRKSLELAQVKEGDFIVEVGPGLGTLTGAILDSKAKLWAVELDKKMYGYVSKIYGGNPDFHIVGADALDFPLANLPAEISEFKIVANLPYAISTPWLDKVLSSRLPLCMSLMLQKEAALRFAEKKSGDDFSPISIFLNSAYDISGTHKVSASCFYPRPKVDSLLLALKLKDKPYIFEPETKELVRKIFSRRRKQIFSIAKDLDVQKLLQWIESAQNFTPQSRPETIEISEWQRLNEILK